MPGLSTSVATQVLDDTIGASAYVALFNGDPEDAGSEIGTVGYGRQLVSFSAASGGIKISSSEVSFSTGETPWGTVDHVALYDVETNGSLLFTKELDVPVEMSDFKTLTIASENLVARLD